jgi:ADP-ribosylglycohydrolase/protein-tyrosine phosphatase
MRQALRSRGREGRRLLPDRLSGAIYGHLVGDALGVPYEFQPAERIGDVAWRGHGTHDQPPGTWSDDGALMLALLDSLLTAGFDTADQAGRALEWREHGAYAPGAVVFDIGTATAAALSRLREGCAPEEAGSVEAKGNGSLMRILPVALVFREADDAELVAMAARASRVTHGSAEAQIACALYVLIARRLLDGVDDRPRVLDEASRSLRSILAEVGLPGSREAEDAAAALLELDAFRAWTDRRGSGRVVDSFWSAWDAFVGAPDHASTVTNAVRYGNDTDTTAAIAGGLAGLYWGLAGIPSSWHRGLRDRHIAQDLADRLVETDDAEWDGTPWRTSRSEPLRIDLLDLGGTSLAGRGRVGMAALPGRRGIGYQTGPHWRDLDTDVATLRDQGVDVLVLLVEDGELVRAGASEITDVATRHGLELVRFPIEDPLLPVDEQAYRRLISSLNSRVAAGDTIVIACRAGLDRTGLTAGCLLREAGLSAAEAIRRVHEAREGTLSLPVHLRYVKDWPPRARGGGHGAASVGAPDPIKHP